MDDMQEQERGLRRRLVALGLGLKPGDFRTAAGVDPVTVSGVLNGARGLPADQAARVGRVVAQRARRLFGA